MSTSELSHLIRPLVRDLHAYVPGEQPKVEGLIKLNTNENPYPPSPNVLKAVIAATDGRLRLYPNPTAQPLREKLAALHGCDASRIFVGNGSDELLSLAVRAFVEPRPPGSEGGQPSESTVQYFAPSYSLYPVLADIHGAHRNSVALRRDFSIPAGQDLVAGGWDPKAALTFVTTPNAPSGRGYSLSELREVCAMTRGVVVLDEAYVDFARENAFALAREFPHVMIFRTFSKAYSLCFQRIGYCFGHPELIAAFDKVKDSYNVNGLAQVAAEATLDDLPYYQANFQKVIATRSRVSAELSSLGFEVLPSQTNFILARPPRLPAERWLALLREKQLIVRWFSAPEVRDYIRITIGTDSEMDRLLAVVRAELASS